MWASAGNWKDIIFEDNFNYNNTDNLLVEIIWVGGSGTFYTIISNTPYYYSHGFSESSTSETMEYRCYWHNRFRLTIEPDDSIAPVSLGQVRSLFK